MIWPQRFALFLLALFFSNLFVFEVEARSQTASNSPPKSVYSVPELVSLALKNNSILNSQIARSEGAHLAGKQERSWSGPSLEMSAGRRKDESTSGPLYEAALSQPLAVLGKKSLRGRLFDLESDSWEAQRAASETAIELDVIQLAIEYAVHRRLADFVEKRQNRFSLIKSYMKGRVFASPQKKAESHIVQNRLAILVSEALQAEADYKSFFEKLRVYVPLGSSPYPEIKVPWFTGKKALEAKEWIEKALQNNPGLRLKDLSVKNADIEKKLASLEKWPDPNLTASFEEGKATEKETNSSVGLSFEFPTWNGNRAGVKSAEKKRDAEEKLREFQEWQLRTEVPRALIEYDAIRLAVQKYPITHLEELETQLRETENGFRKGQVDLLTFLELDSTVSETFTQVLESQSIFMAKLAELFRLSGERDIVGRLESF